ncbi:MAG: hypothetical protein ABL963_04735 [Longimicrobiales bacterium]
MNAPQSSRSPSKPGGVHVGTIAHEGLLWDAYLEFADDPRRPLTFRARIRFDRAAGPDGAGESATTTVLIIEDSYEEAVAKARGMDDRQLTALLRSTLPDGR